MGLDIKSVLVVDGVGPNCAQILQQHGIGVTEVAKISKEQLLKEVPVSTGCQYYMSMADVLFSQREFGSTLYSLHANDFEDHNVPRTIQMKSVQQPIC